ncbi:hypothetical protein [Neisseria meningitidis]|uniref:hypothetical protein n=1 Tax=Neisseria meningitidis TaxID=487 RepID=UPI00163F6757|nr:hypothetical protein [Neisseria meningitidis]
MPSETANGIQTASSSPPTALDGIRVPSFPRRRESRTSGSGNIQRLSESLRF